MANVPAKHIKVSGKFGSYGEDGATFTPHVSEDGILSWTNDRGVDNPPPVSIRGPQGESAYIPVFNLSEMGLSAVPLAGGTSELEGNMTDICAALDAGPVTFGIPFSMSGVTIVATLVMNGASTSGDYQCSCIVNYIAPGVVIVNVNATGLMVTCASLRNLVGDSIPTPITDDNDKILQVINGEYTLVSVKDSAVATFVDDYINEALGGEY